MEGGYGYDYYDEGQYGEYDENGDHHEQQAVVYAPPEGHIHDEDGRLLKGPGEIIDYETLPEDFETFTCEWQPQSVCSSKDWHWSSKYVWPEIDQVVLLKRLDLFQTDFPLSQQATTNPEEAHTIRNNPAWYPVRSIFVLPFAISTTKEIVIEATGPPRRHKYRPVDKRNARDFSRWIEKEKLHFYRDSDRIAGVMDFFVDFKDMPDRYFLSTEAEPDPGNRRLYRFGGYSATQYYILEKRIHHEALDSEGGKGMTYVVQRGPIIFAKKNWRVIGSFFGFDRQLDGSSRFTIYTRTDPFPRMLIAMDKIEHEEEWVGPRHQFYAFDIPVPGSVPYCVHHCLRSIHSSAAVIPRHRLTSADPRNPWEFRQRIYVMPAGLRDCSFSSEWMPESF